MARGLRVFVAEVEDEAVDDAVGRVGDSPKLERLDRLIGDAGTGLAAGCA